MGASTGTVPREVVNGPPQERARTIMGATLVGLAAFGLGFAAHALSGGASPTALILLALAVLTVLGSVLVAQAQLPMWAVLLLLGAAQQVLHWLLGGLGGGASPSSGVLDHHGESVPRGVSTAGAGHSPEVMLMLHTHLAAALLVGWAMTCYPRIAGWASRRHGRRYAKALPSPDGSALE